MGHTSCFSAPSNYSLQAGNWHPSPSMSVLHTQSQVGWEAAWALQTWAQASFLVLGALPATIHSVPPDHSPQGLLPRPGCSPCNHSLSHCPHPSPSISAPDPTARHSRSHVGAAFSPWALSSFPNGRTFFPTAGANQGDNRTWLLDTGSALSPHILWRYLITVEMMQAPPPDPKFSINLQ